MYTWFQRFQVLCSQSSPITYGIQLAWPYKSFKARLDSSLLHSLTRTSDITLWIILNSNNVLDYVDDVCPYATFQLPENPPGRPLLTKGEAKQQRFNRHTGDTLYNVGNIYSGPYHSVQSPGFLYGQATMPIRVSFLNKSNSALCQVPHRNLAFLCFMFPFKYEASMKLDRKDSMFLVAIYD